MKKFDFVNSDPTVGFTKSDLTKIRSRAAKNDPFEEIAPSKIAKRPRGRPRKTQVIPPVTQHSGPPAVQGDPASEDFQDDLEFDEEIPVINDSGALETNIWPNIIWAEPVSSSNDDSLESDDNLRLLQYSNPRRSSISYLGAMGHDPFWTMPIPFQPCLPIIWHHHVTHLTPRVAGLDGQGENNLFRWFSVGFTEPASLYGHLAFAASHLASTGTTARTLRTEDILYLKGAAMSLVNNALSDPSRATSDAIISAVIVLAGHEFAFGDNEHYHAHMHGAQRMIELRGGLKALSPFFQKLIPWIREGTDCWKIHWPLNRGVDVKASLGATSKEMAIKRRAKAFTRNNAWSAIPGVPSHQCD